VRDTPSAADRQSDQGVGSESSLKLVDDFLPSLLRRRVRFETHPLHAKFAFLVADDKQFQVFQVGLARLRFSSGNSDVMVPAHRSSLSVELAQILGCRYRVSNRALVTGLLRHEVKLYFTGFGTRQIRNA
jgi:hypothetical protein